MLKLAGHNDCVTSVGLKRRQLNKNKSQFYVRLLASSSRDKGIIIWDLAEDRTEYDFKRLNGHYHFVQCIFFFTNSRRCISGAWDSTLRLWHSSKGSTTLRFVGHRNDVLCVTVSPDELKIVSGSRDKYIMVWNRAAQCVFRFHGAKQRSGWVSAVVFRPGRGEFIVSSG